MTAFRASTLAGFSVALGACDLARTSMPKWWRRTAPIRRVARADLLAVGPASERAPMQQAGPRTAGGVRLAHPAPESGGPLGPLSFAPVMSAGSS